jgi:hypothetical protein
MVQYSYLGMGTIAKESHRQVARGLNVGDGSAEMYGGWGRVGRIAGREWGRW